MFCRKNDADSYAQTIREAWDGLEARPGASAAAATGADFDPESRSLSIGLLRRRMQVRLNDRTVAPDRGGEPTLVEKVLVLHHLSFSDGASLSGTKVAFREIPGCKFYNTTFAAHTTAALVSAFGNDSASFVNSCEALGGVKEAGSGSVVKIPAFPNVPVWLCYWRGDDEMPPGAQLLYDSSVSRHLPAEDIAVLGEYVVHRVVGADRLDGCGCVYEN